MPFCGQIKLFISQPRHFLACSDPELLCSGKFSKDRSSLDPKSLKLRDEVLAGARVLLSQRMPSSCPNLTILYADDISDLNLPEAVTAQAQNEADEAAKDPFVAVLNDFIAKRRQIVKMFCTVADFEDDAQDWWNGLSVIEYSRWKDFVERGTARIAVTGNMKSGKSTFVNFLLTNRTDTIVAPVAAHACTARVTKFENGPEEILLGDVTQPFADFGKKLYELVNLPEKERENDSAALLVTARMPGNRLLSRGCEIWDIPGLGEKRLLSNLALSAVEQCDFCFYLVPPAWDDAEGTYLSLTKRFFRSLSVPPSSD